jgi:uncharacterized repeat protein (TIGR01451 family)
MITSQKLTHTLLAYLLLGMLYGMARAADPGLQADFSITKSGPASITAGDNATYTLTVTNNSSSSLLINATVTDTLPAGFTLVSIGGPGANCSAMGTSSATCAVNLRGGEAITIRLVAHSPALCQPATATNTATVTATGVVDPNPLNNTATTTTTVLQPSLGPGACFPPGSQISDDKAGSILFYNFYTSGSSSSTENNARVSLTNTNPTQGVAVHLFFVDGATCSIADAFVCLTANQTVAFLMSDVDPGVSGYIVAIAVDGPPGTAEGRNTGCPISFNFLIGNVYVKSTFSPRRDADLAAETVEAEFGSPVPGCDVNSSTATLLFNGVPGQGYNRLPRVLAASNIASRADGNSTLLIVNRIGGNLATGAATLGTLFGVLYDDAENGFSFSLVGPCQLRGELSNNFPRTTPRLDNLIPTGRSGWLKIWSQDEVGILGAIILENRNATANPNAFNGGHNLHKLTFNNSVSLIVPIFPPSC